MPLARSRAMARDRAWEQALRTRLELRPQVSRDLDGKVAHMMRETASPARSAEALLDRPDDPWSPVRDDEQRVAEATPAPIADGRGRIPTPISSNATPSPAERCATIKSSASRRIVNSSGAGSVLDRRADGALNQIALHQEIEHGRDDACDHDRRHGLRPYHTKLADQAGDAEGNRQLGLVADQA